MGLVNNFLEKGTFKQKAMARIILCSKSEQKYPSLEQFDTQLYRRIPLYDYCNYMNHVFLHVYMLFIALFYLTPTLSFFQLHLKFSKTCTMWG